MVLVDTPTGRRLITPTTFDILIGVKKLFYKLSPDLGENMQLVADTGDTSADGDDVQAADEVVDGGEGLLG